MQRRKIPTSYPTGLWFYYFRIYKMAVEERFEEAGQLGVAMSFSVV
jgi:hypothetical protein